MAALILAKAPPRRAIQLPKHVRYPQVMAAPPAVTVTASSYGTLPRTYGAGSANGQYSASNSHGGVFAYARTIPAATPVGSAGFEQEPTITPGTGAATATGSAMVSFVHTGTSLEVVLVIATGGVLLRVDDEYVSLTPTTIATNPAAIKLDFGAVRKTRRIDVIGSMSFCGVCINAADDIWAAPIRGPRVICVGDSFTTNAAGGWPNWFADAMGWDDVWASGVGGTGLLNTNGGASKTFRQRLASDVLPFKPDIVVMHGGVNDGGAGAATLQVEAASFVAAIRAALPECIVIGGANGSGGVEKLPAATLDLYDAIAAGWSSAGGIWASPMQMPLKGVLANSILPYPIPSGFPGNTGVKTAAGQTAGLMVNAPLRIGTTVEVGSGAVRERMHLTGFAVASGKPVYAFDGAFQYAHAAGEAVTEVGPAYLTGRGNAGAVTNWGNADLYVSSDAVHPTSAGQIAIGQINARLVRSALAALTAADRTRFAVMAG